MATDFTGFEGSIFLDASFKSSKPLDLSTPVDALAWRQTLEFVLGDGDSEADMIRHDRVTLAANETASLNLFAFTNAFGVAASFARVRAVLVRNISVESTYSVPAIIRIGNAGASAWKAWFADVSDKEILEAGGLSAHVCPDDGWEAVDNTHKYLMFENLNTENDVWVADTVTTIGHVVKPTVPNGFEYRCTARAGDFKTHATTEPVWPTTLGATIVDDMVTWECINLNDATYEIVIVGVSA